MKKVLEFFENINFRRTSIEKLHFAQRFGTKREQMQRLLRELTEFPKKSIIPQGRVLSAASNLRLGSDFAISSQAYFLVLCAAHEDSEDSSSV